MERALRILRTRALCAGVSLEDVEELAEAGQGEVSGEVQQEGQEGEGGEAERPDGVLRLGEHAPNVEDDTLQGVDIGDGWLRSPRQPLLERNLRTGIVVVPPQTLQHRVAGALQAGSSRPEEKIAGLARVCHAISGGAVDLR